MTLSGVTRLDSIKHGDTVIITGDTYRGESFKNVKIKVSPNYGTEIILRSKGNIYFNLGMYLEGKSWVKEAVVLNL